MTQTTETAIAVATDTAPAALNLFSIDMFRDAWKVAEQLAKSKLIPQNFQNNPPDCIIAMEMAQRIGASIFAVMQSLYIVHGRPGWSAQFIIAALNSCGRFSPLRFDISGDRDERTCMAWALEKGTGEKLTGPPVSIDLAKKEGWYAKNGSKWQTMPELMLRYRAATFFGRLYAPDILMGMRTAEELHDTDDIIDLGPSASVVEDLNRRFAVSDTPKAENAEVVNTETGEITPAPQSTKSKPKAEKPGNATPPRQAELRETVPPPVEPPPIENDSLPVQASPPRQADADKIRAYMNEINAKQTSYDLDQWRFKHHKRVANALGGEQSDEYLNVMDYAEVRYRDLLEGEGQGE